MSYMLRCPKQLWPWQLRDTKISLFPPPPKKKTRWGSRCFSCRHLSKVPLVLGQDVGILRPTRVWWRGWRAWCGWPVRWFDPAQSKKTHQEKMTMTKIPKNVCLELTLPCNVRTNSKKNWYYSCKCNYDICSDTCIYINIGDRFTHFQFSQFLNNSITDQSTPPCELPIYQPPRRPRSLDPEAVV